MARLTFPSGEDRLAYGVSAGGLLTAKPGTKVRIYSDAAATTLADIQTVAGAAIANSELTVDSGSQVPLFLGPDGVATLYVKAVGGSAISTIASTDRVAKTTVLTGNDAPVLTITQSAASNNSNYALSLTSDAASKGRLIALDHNAAGDAQAYALDIKQRPGALSAFVVHRYSSAAPGAVLDSTAAGAILRLRNTENPTNSPGSFGTSDYAEFWGYGTPTTYTDGVTTSGSAILTSATAAFITSDIGKTVTGTGILAGTIVLTRDSATQVTLSQNATATASGVSFTIPRVANVATLGTLDKSLYFRAKTTAAGFGFVPDAASTALYIAQGYAARGLDVLKTTGTEEAVRVTQNAAGRALSVIQNGAAHAVEVTAAAGATGFYPLLINGYNLGPKISTSQNSGQTLLLQKDGTGAGQVVYLINKGTDFSIEFRTASARVATVNADGEFEHYTVGKGLLLRSPNGTRYRLSIADGGTVSVVAAP